MCRLYGDWKHFIYSVNDFSKNKKKYKIVDAILF